MHEPTVVSDFWRQVRSEVPGLPQPLPEAWAFGATPEQAEELLELVLAGIKTGTASSLWDYEAGGDDLPRAGDLSVILDGHGIPQAVIETYDVRIDPFGEVSAEHAWAEGEGDRSLAHWRTTHEKFWREYSENSRGFEADMPVVYERFLLIYPQNGVG